MKKSSINTQLKAWVALLLLIGWSLVLSTGIVMYLAPHGQGNRSFLFGLTRHDWGEVHWWLALVAVMLTTIHVVVDWKPFTVLLRKLFRPQLQP